jgi:hypothetical protein
MREGSRFRRGRWRRSARRGERRIGSRGSRSGTLPRWVEGEDEGGLEGAASEGAEPEALRGL